MCDWSNWQFICEGRYDILLAILTGIALFGSIAMMLLTAFGVRYRAKHPHARALRGPRAAFISGEIGAGEAIDRAKDRK